MCRTVLVRMMSGSDSDYLIDQMDGSIPLILTQITLKVLCGPGPGPGPNRPATFLVLSWGLAVARVVSALPTIPTFCSHEIHLIESFGDNNIKSIIRRILCRSSSRCGRTFAGALFAEAQKRFAGAVGFAVSRHSRVDYPLLCQLGKRFPYIRIEL